MRKCIYVILGCSRSGKDTALKVLEKELGGESYKFSSPCKRVLETLSDLNWGDLDRDEIRNSIIPNHSKKGTSYLDVMVKAFKHFRAVDNNIMLHSTRGIIPYILESKNVFITDLRTIAELNTLLSFNVPIKVLRVYRKGTEPNFWQKLFYDLIGRYLTDFIKFPANIISDEYLEEIDFNLRMFYSDLFLVVYNDGSKEDFEEKLRKNYIELLRN